MILIKLTKVWFTLCAILFSTMLNAQIYALDQINYPSKQKKIAQKILPNLETSANAHQKRTSWSGYIGKLVQNTDSIWLRILLVLLLGMLLSLTPCIYPMIPITMGILQSQGSTSIIKNFLIAFAYTTGIASTFALLGLSAACTGQLFGSLMTNPFVVIIIVSLMIYLAGSMIGLYNLYIPLALRPNNSSVKNGSYVSAFLFGAASGTVASPCLSPGLVLLLSLVTACNKLMGFALLFFFGIGLGIPLLIIGTFSGSLNIFPKAGTWMIEIKKFFGFIMLAMCFYFLNNLIPWHILIWIMAVFILLTGIFYIYSAQKNISAMWRFVKNGLGIVLIASSLFLFIKAYQALYIHNKSMHETIWLCEYTNAITKAKQENKYVFLDVGAPFCSICSAIDKKLLCKTNVVQSLKNFVPVKIDGSDATHAAHTNVRKKFKIMGVPAFIVINPFDEQEIKRWGSELYEATDHDFSAELNTCAAVPFGHFEEA